MRALGVVVLSCLACTRPNPAFDATTAGEGEQTGGPNTAETIALDTVVLDTTAVTGLATDPDITGPDTTDSDLPGDPSCGMSLSPGLSIQLGDPAQFEGDTCPTELSFSMMVMSVGDSEIVLARCMKGCMACEVDGYPLSVAPLPVGIHVPAATCLQLEARELVLQTATRCHWGALTIYDPVPLAPHVIATVRALDPTPAVLDLLDAAVLDPMKGVECDCAAIVPQDACCPQAEPPSFWYYTIDGHDVYAGQETMIDLADPGGLEHSFRLFQAEQIPTCAQQELQLSWAVVAVP